MRKNLLRVRATGPLVPFVAGFRAELESNGYRPSTVANQLLLLVHVSHWLEEQGLGADELTPERSDDFLIVRRAAGYTQWTSAKGMTQLLAHLRRIGAAPTPVPVSTTPIDDVLAAYRNYLLEERGLALTSVDNFVRVARRFLDEHGDATGVHLGGVAPGDVLRFVTEQCRLHNPNRIATGLRAFLRYCYLQGLTASSLSEAVPRVANWRLSSLPKTLEPEHVRSLLASCDQRTALGARNFAIVTVLVRLGLRASEVANLELGDIDWRSGELLVRGKGSRIDHLPLPVDVGEAIAHWLEDGRPQCAHSNVFIRMLAPLTPLSGNGVSAVVRAACRRAGLATVGSHRLRHTAASEMLRAGSNLTEIGQVLRHRSLDTTAISVKNRSPRTALRRPALAIECVVSALGQSLADYLTMRREFGYKLKGSTRLLAQFVTFCEQRGAEVVTVELALTWATLPTNCSPVYGALRLGMVRGFARYLHAFDSRTGVLPLGLLPSGKKRATPYLYSTDQVRSLMAAARDISSPRRALTTEAIIGLLAASGLRIGEALALDRGDVNLTRGVVTIRHAKFDKSHLVPLHPSCVAALLTYSTRRDQLIPRTSAAFFASPTGRRVHHCSFSATFHALVIGIELEARPLCRPRVHDLRHSFAVNVLTRWYEEGADVSAQLPSLSTYMGHVDPADTYWYLSGSPELFEQAVPRLEATYEVEQ